MRHMNTEFYEYILRERTTVRTRTRIKMTACVLPTYVLARPARLRHLLSRRLKSMQYGEIRRRPLKTDLG